MDVCSISRAYFCRFRRMMFLIPALLLLLLFLSLQPHNLRWVRMALPAPEWMSPTRQCIPATNVGFLKTHKCASSAIQNILFRYAMHQDLRLVLPTRSNYLGGRIPFHASMVKDAPWHGLGYNIFAVHTKWNFKQVAFIMPSNTLYISIVRDPVDLFESLYNYDKFSKVTHQKLEEYVVHVNSSEPRKIGFLGINQMVWDFGLPDSMMDNITAVQELVADSDLKFDLVMVAERMDESLVLLKNLLCWSWEDVVVLRVNARKEKFKTKLSHELREVLKSKLEPDYLLYDHFYTKFDNLVEQFGRDRMAKEVQELKTTTMELLVKCDFQKKDASKMRGPNKPWNVMVEGYETRASDPDCRDFSRVELNFLDLLRKRQWAEARRNKGSPNMDTPFGAIPLDGVSLQDAVQRLKAQLMHKHIDPPK